MGLYFKIINSLYIFYSIVKHFKHAEKGTSLVWALKWATFRSAHVWLSLIFSKDSTGNTFFVPVLFSWPYTRTLFIRNGEWRIIEFGEFSYQNTWTVYTKIMWISYTNNWPNKVSHSAVQILEQSVTIKISIR